MITVSKQEARTQGVSQGTVSLRLKFHDMLPVKIKEFIGQDEMSEDHCRRITEILVAQYFTPWLTSAGLWLFLAEEAIEKGLTVAKLKERIDHRWSN